MKHWLCLSYTGNPSEALIMAFKSTVLITSRIESLLEGRERQVQLKSEFEDIAM